METRHLVADHGNGRVGGLIAFVGILALALPAAGQVSINVLEGGADSLTVDPGEVSLSLDIQATSSISLSGLQWSLISSHSDLFVYDNPSRVIGTPFTGADALLSAPAAGSSLSAVPVQLFFKMSGDDYPADQFPSVVMTQNVRSVGALPDGTYTFVAGDNGQGFFWTGNATNGTFDSVGMFTLIVGTGVEAGGGGGGGDPGTGGGTGGGDTGGGDTGGDGDTSDGDTSDGDTGDSDGDVVIPDPGTEPSDGDGDTGDTHTGDDDDQGDTAEDDGGAGGGVDTDDGADSAPVTPPPCGNGLVETGTLALGGMLLASGHRRRRSR